MEWPVSRPRKAEEENMNAYWGDSNDFNFDHVTPSQTEASSLSLQEIPFDRDTKWCNVAIGSRPRPKVNFGHGFGKAIGKITSSNSAELESLDEHYKLLQKNSRRLDAKKLEHDNRGKNERQNKISRRGNMAKPANFNNLQRPLNVNSSESRPNMKNISLAKDLNESSYNKSNVNLNFSAPVFTPRETPI